MRTTFKRLLACFAALALLVCALASCNKEPAHVDYATAHTFDPASTDTVKVEVTVKSFIDGDTTHFYVPESVSKSGVLKARYLGINTPESTGQIEPYGKKASTFTKEKLSGATSIYLESDNGKWNLDSTGARHLVWVWYKPAGSDTYRNLNLEIMQNGLAIQSNSAQNRYGDSCVAAFNQAVAEALHIHSGIKDPDFHYGSAIELTLKELRCNITEYMNKTVAFEAIVTKNSGNDGVYVEAYDEETGMYHGIYLYYGKTPNPGVTECMKIGNRLRVVGTVTEHFGSYQVSSFSFSQYRPTAKDLQILDNKVHEAAYLLTDPARFTTGTVEIVGEDAINTYSYAELATHTTVTFKDLRVVRTYTTNNPDSSSLGAISIYCVAPDGTEITVRTAVLKDADGKLVTSDYVEGQTITVRGIVDYYDPDSGEEDNGDFHYQIKVLSYGDLIIQES